MPEETEDSNCPCTGAATCNCTSRLQLMKLEKEIPGTDDTKVRIAARARVNDYSLPFFGICAVLWIIRKRIPRKGVGEELDPSLGDHDCMVRHVRQ
jgi:hypothetical protein